MNLCICCGLLTFDHCRDCRVPLCWPCGFAGLCGVCKRMEILERERTLITVKSALATVPLILTEEFMPWAGNVAKIRANEETECIEAKG